MIKWIWNEVFPWHFQWMGEGQGVCVLPSGSGETDVYVSLFEYQDHRKNEIKWMYWMTHRKMTIIENCSGNKHWKPKTSHLNKCRFSIPIGFLFPPPPQGVMSEENGQPLNMVYNRLHKNAHKKENHFLFLPVLVQDCSRYVYVHFYH